MRGITMGLIGVGAVLTLAGCGTVAVRAGGHDDPRSDPPDGPKPDPDPDPDPGTPGGAGTKPDPDPGTDTPPGGKVKLESNWAPTASAALDALATTDPGARLIADFRKTHTPIVIDDSINTPARYEYSISTRSGHDPVITPKRVAVQSAALSDARTAATLIGHELTHAVTSRRGTALNDAVYGASSISTDAQRIMDETLAYTVQRELVEQLRPQPTPKSYSYDPHSMKLDGHNADGTPKFARKTLTETFDAVASDPVYISSYDLKPDQFRAEHAAVVAALKGSVDALGAWVPKDHVSAE